MLPHFGTLSLFPSEQEFPDLANSMHAVALFCMPFFYLAVTAYALVPQVGSSSPWPRALLHINTTTITLNDKPVSNASSASSASNFNIYCFDDVPGFLPVTMANYFAAVQQILIREDAMVPRQFWLGPSLEMRWEWTGGTRGDDDQVNIVLFSKAPILTDAFPLMLVAQVAAMIADACITAMRSYAGGWASPGVGRGTVAVVNPKSNGIRGVGLDSTGK